MVPRAAYTVDFAQKIYGLHKQGLIFPLLSDLD